MNINSLILKLGKKYLRPDLIIFFGDYVGSKKEYGNLVREGDLLVEYKNIIKIFIVSRKTSQEKNITFSRQLIIDIKNNLGITNDIEILIENVFAFKKYIRENRYFYLDLLTNGVITYNSNIYDFFKKNLIPDGIMKLKKDDFNNYFSLASEFLIDSDNAKVRGNYKLSIFYLHQSFEFYITCYLLVIDGYKSKTHDILILYSKMKTKTKLFNDIFDLEKELELFELLRGAYIGSRYQNKYKVNVSDLFLIKQKIIILSQIVKKLCLKELNET